MYQNMEMRNRDKAKHKIERQYQIVKPDASPEEIRQVVEGGQEVQVFAQAVGAFTSADTDSANQS
jgi:t-SNARE complex subunit (syntaxin)